MITEFESGVRLVELGRGTTFISQAIVTEDNENNISSGIAFSNYPSRNIGDNGVIIK